MRVAYVFFVIIAGLCLSGCEAVFTRQPVGEETVKLDPQVWQGTWLSDEIVVLTTVLDGENGVLHAAWVERAAEGARFETVTGSVRRTGDMLFLNMEHRQVEDGQPEVGAASGRDTEGPKEDTGENMPAGAEFYWARIENDGRRAVLWWPDVEQIRLAVKAGQLPGTIKQDQDVILEPLDASRLARIGSPESSLLKWSQPVIFIRIGD